MDTDSKFGDETVSQIFSRTMQGALEQQARDQRKALEPLIGQLSDLTKTVSNLAVNVAVVVEQYKHTHTAPCGQFVEFKKDQQEENKLLHKRIDDHKDNDHRNDRKERSVNLNTIICAISALAAIGAVVAAVL